MALPLEDPTKGIVMNENWCDWHVIVVEGDEDDPDITVMHPGCPFTVTVGLGGPGHEFEYACAIQWEIENVRFDSLLGDHRDVDGIFRKGWYRARMQHRAISGFDWSEIDTEYEVEPLVVGDRSSQPLAATVDAPDHQSASQ
jgi:hypothetical protein